MQPDKELLRQYATAKSEDAFAELVRRHVNLVYSAARRQVGGDAHLAHDVAQSVFTDLARKAFSLSQRESLTGWLYTSAHFAASKLVRAEHRRRQREEQFMSDPAHVSATELDWETLRPILDSAMHGLHETDREAVLLRYFENRPYAEVGAKLGLNENAARMRVERALEKLRTVLGRPAITATATLASVISANAVQVAPAALAVTLTKTSLAAAGAGTSFALFKLMTLAQFKVGLGAVVAAGAVATMVLQHQSQQQLHSENESLRRQLAQLKTDVPEPAAVSKTTTSDEFDELLRLRGEVNSLRAQTNQIPKLQAQNQQLREAVTNLAQKSQHSADDQPDEKEQAFAILQMTTAKQSIMAMMLYANDHPGESLTNFDQAANYFKAGDSATTNLGNFEITYAGPFANLANPSSAIVVRQIQPFTRNGVLLRAYGFGDGHSELHRADNNGSFAEWEQQHLPLPKNPPGQM